MLKYKGYTGHIEVDTESNLLHGRVLDIKDVITFEGVTIDEVKQAFYDSVDFCESLAAVKNNYITKDI